MIITATTIDISQPKTGSTWRRRCLAPIIGAETNFLDGKEYRNGHVPLHRFSSAALEGRTVRAVVRNPWDWYVSTWCHMRGSVAKSSQIRRQFTLWAGGREPTWESVLYGWTHPWELEALPDREDAVYNPGTAASRFRRTCNGLWTWHTSWFHGIAMCSVWPPVRIDSAQQVEAYAALYPEHADAIRAQAPINVGTTDGEWWTPERVRWVEEADDFLSRRFGYDGPGAVSSRGPMWRL